MLCFVQPSTMLTMVQELMLFVCHLRDFVENLCVFHRESLFFCHSSQLRRAQTTRCIPAPIQHALRHALLQKGHDATSNPSRAAANVSKAFAQPTLRALRCGALGSSPQAMMREGTMRISSESKDSIISFPPSASAAARPRISMPRGCQGGS